MQPLAEPLLRDAAPEPPAGTARLLLTSHVLTKFGSKAWEFATPLLLLEFSPGDLGAPCTFGLSVLLFKFVFGPMCGSWMDRAARPLVIQWGIGLQCAGVGLALCVLGLLVASRPQGPSLQGAAAAEAAAAAAAGRLPVGLLLAMIGCGSLEVLGAMISSVAVKKDWVPTVWADRKSAHLAAVNVAMGNIDLACEMLGPICAGLVLQWAGGATGFALVGVANLLSFGLEALLLYRVLGTCPVLRAPKPQAEGAAPHKCLLMSESFALFARQPSGVPLLVLSYALLWFTVLSPHGVVLTAYLQTRHVSPPALSLFRALGALSGLAGMHFFKVAGPRLGLRRICALNLTILTAAVAAAALAFGAIPSSGGLGAPTVLFLGCIVLSRFGLYGFDTGLLQLEQLHVDEAHRGAIGAVESTLCSLGSMSIYIATLVAARDPGAFGRIVHGSALFVAAGAASYLTWYTLWHEHEHRHPEGSASPGHAHTTQQKRELTESGGLRTHTHLHFHPSDKCVPKAAHGHGHGHSHGHGEAS